MDRDGTREGFEHRLTNAIVDAVNVPVIASGGVGTLDHLVDGIVEGRADAVLAASIFHFGEHTIADAKRALIAAGVRTVRPPRRLIAADTVGCMPQTKMPYRRLGRSGLQLSVLSFGSWVTFDTQLKDDLALDCMQAAHDAGCNFFDNAEAYAGGESEAIMGRVIEQLGWKRQSYVLSTKVFWGIDGNMPNMHEHAQPQVPAPRDRGLPRPAARSTSSTCCSAIAPTRTRRSRRPCGR